MSEAEQLKWDRRYSEGEYVPRSWPSPFIEEWLSRVEPGRALDIACGAGRNSHLLAEHGFQVVAMDISKVAVEMGKAEARTRALDIEWRVVDLDEVTLPSSAFDLITVVRYRNESLWPKLKDALAPGGWLLAEHHYKSGADVDGPSMSFRLDPGELLAAFDGLVVEMFEEVIEPARDGQRYALQRIAAHC